MAGVPRPGDEAGVVTGMPGRSPSRSLRTFVGGLATSVMRGVELAVLDAPLPQLPATQPVLRLQLPLAHG